MHKRHKAAPPPSEPAQQARLIQSMWRRKFRYLRSQRIVEQFYKDGPTVEHVKSIRYGINTPCAHHTLFNCCFATALNRWSSC